MSTDPPAPIGVIANPRSGTDVRRVIAAAGSSTLDDKINIIRRIALGARRAGAARLVVHREPHQMVRRATETMRDLELDWIDQELTFTEEDTVVAARAMRDRGCAVVVVLGGDGTNRAAAKGWPDLTVVPVSTGTNNAFPVFVEATVAGAAAGLVATGRVDPGPHLHRQKVVRVTVEAEADDLALIDALTVDDPYVGSLELFDPATLGTLVLARAEPAAIGFSGVGGLLEPVDADDDAGLLVRFRDAAGADLVVDAPTAPGHYARLGVDEVRRLALDEPVTVTGPMLLAYDGERKRRVHEGVRVTFAVRRDGPCVLDVAAVLREAAHRGLYRA